MNFWLLTILRVLFIVAMAPLLIGFLKLIKCWLQNRSAPSLFQPYRNLHKLFRKDMVIAMTASSIFRITPYIVFGLMVLASAMLPVFIIGFSNVAIADAIVLVGLFALARFFLTLAGMDTGTAFGGMGSSREMLISSIAEPALLMAFFTVAMVAGSTNLDVIASHIAQQQFILRPSLLLAAVGFAIVGLAETGRIPIDNPTTHLELTMIHEAMVLEYSGRNLALLEWAAQIKFTVYCILFVTLFFPIGIASHFDWPTILVSFFALILKLMSLCLILGIAETHLAKLRLFRAPYVLHLAFLLCLLGVLNHIILEVL